MKIYKLCEMLMSLGHDVYLYGAEKSNANCTEFIQTHTLKDIRNEWGEGWNLDTELNVGYDWRANGFKHDFNMPRTETTQKYYKACIEEINKRKRDDDFLLVMQGVYQKPVGDGVNLWLTCEPGIGYRGSYCRFRAFESAYLMNFMYGSEHPRESINGNYYDRVIPNYFDPKDFPFREEKEDYYLYMGRMIVRKGVYTALKAVEAVGGRLLLAGQGVLNLNGYRCAEFIGYLEPDQRADLMGRAKAVFVPTEYLEAFGGVNVESQLCFPENTCVIANNILRTYQRQYTGDLITISTKYGSITSTPNHPFYTNEGWIPAIDMTEKHQLLYNRKYETREIYTRRIKDIVRELQENRDSSDCQIVRPQSAIGSSKGFQIKTQENMARQAQNASSNTYENRSGLLSRIYRWRWINNITKVWEQDKPPTLHKIMQYVRSFYRMAQGTSKTTWDLCLYKKPWRRFFGWHKASNVCILPSEFNELSDIQGIIALFSYQEASNASSYRVDRNTIEENKASINNSKATGLGDDDEILEFTTVNNIRKRQVKNISVYNLGTRTGTYEANGYLVHNCGTPTITTNFGVFPETIIHNKTGFLCDTLQDFVDAAKNVDKLDPKVIRKHAERYLMDNVKWEYQKWFDDIYQLYLSVKEPGIKGWHHLRKD